MMAAMLPRKELIDRLRFLEAHECELASAERDPIQRAIHFKKAEFHAACMTFLKRREEGSSGALGVLPNLETRSSETRAVWP